MVSAPTACGSAPTTKKSATPTTQAKTPTQATPTPTVKPTQGPPRATVDQMEKDISFPYDPIIEAYDQPTATVQVAFKFGTAVVVSPTTVKSVTQKYMKGHFDQHKDVYISKVAVQIYGTIRRGTA